LERRQLRRQVVRIGAVISLLIVGGTVGYYLLGYWLGRPDTLMDCFYMTVITLATVGYGEVIKVAETPQGRMFSALLILVGVGTLFYALSSLAVITLEGILHGAWRQWRMERRIATLKDHFIVCGCGNVGEVIVRELVLTKRPVVAVDRDSERLVNLAAQLDVPYVVGDATEEATLRSAGIERAAGYSARIFAHRSNKGRKAGSLCRVGKLVHASAGVPPQVAWMTPTGTFRCWRNSRAKK